MYAGSVKLHSFALRAFLLSVLTGGLLGACPATLEASAAAQTSKRAPTGSIILDSTVTLQLGPEAPGPVEEAAKDLQKDIAKKRRNPPK